jgi:hypothetical protein
VNDGHFSFVSGSSVQGAVACGSYADWTEPGRNSGFGSVSIETFGPSEDTIQAHAAGYLEAALTQGRIHDHFTNIHQWLMGHFKNGSIPPVYEAWFNTQDAWIRSQIEAKPSDPYWQAVAVVMAQFDGLVAGYQATAPADQQLSVFDFQQLNGVGDLLDLISALQPDVGIPDWKNMTPEEIMAEVRSRNHCSGLIKITGNFSDIFAAHSSWFTYQSMLRAYKHYKFDYSNPVFAARKTSFSSYPGLLSSLDDHYINTDSNLVMVQTTNSILDSSLYQKVTTESLLAWHRVRLANYISDDGKTWCDTLRRANSGTYNNQYMVVDYKLFTPGAALKPNTLWVCEQIPGMVAAGDETQTLERGEWVSYNVPYFASIYNASGYPQFIRKYAGTPNPDEDPGALSGMHYQLAPRAKLFRRDVGTANTWPGFKAIMRENTYPNDPYFPSMTPFDAICSRGDLTNTNGGCYDSKVTRAEWVGQHRVECINGPTRGTGDIYEPFDWSKSAMNATVSHVGQPTVFDFEFQTELPTWTP